jgi:chromosome segregation ATPase/predicted regulator of Ras-like GTPase activity (Roadblock/LC7/MglB family)
MDVVQSIWVSSVTGAGLFMSVGLLVSRAFPPKAGPNPLQQGESEARQLAEAQIAAYQKQNEEAARQLAEERSQGAALRARIQSDAQTGEQLQNERRLRDEARQEAQRLTASLTRLEAEATQLRAAAGNAGRAGDSRQLADENGRLRAQLGQLSNEIEAYRGQHQQRDAELHAMRAQLQQRDAELQAIRAQLATSESRGSMAQKQVQAAEGQIQRGREQLQELQNARARAEAEVAQLRESIKNAGQAATGGAAAATARVQQLEAKVAELTRKASEGEARQREVQQLTTQLTAAQAKSNEATQLAQQLAAAQARLTQVDAKEAQQLSVAQAHATQAQQLAQQLTTAQGQIRDARAALVSAENRAQEAVRLRDDNTALRAQIAELQKSGGQDSSSSSSLSEGQRRDVEMALKARALAQRNEEFDIHIAEIESLRTKVDNLTDAANETVSLRERVRELEAQGYAAQIVRGDGWTKRPAKTNAGPDRLENMLQNKLEALVTDTKGGRTAVLADLRGLLIAASGDTSFQDELAAAASLTTYTTTRLQELFPMGKPLALEMMDVNRVLLRVDWLHMDDDAFLLTTVGLAPEPTAVREGHARGIMDELAGD